MPTESVADRMTVTVAVDDWFWMIVLIRFSPTAASGCRTTIEVSTLVVL